MKSYQCKACANNSQQKYPSSSREGSKTMTTTAAWKCKCSNLNRAESKRCPKCWIWKRTVVASISCSEEEKADKDGGNISRVTRGSTGEEENAVSLMDELTSWGSLGNYLFVIRILLATVFIWNCMMHEIALLVTCFDLDYHITRVSLYSFRMLIPYLASTSL